MLLCNSGQYKKVVEEYQSPPGSKLRHSKEKHREAHSRSPPKIRADDLQAFLDGQGSVYGSPHWQKQWQGERFLPDVKVGHSSQVLLPFVQESEKKRQLAAKEAKRKRQQAPSEAAEQLAERPHSTENVQPRSRPMTPSAQVLMDKERQKQAERPKSAGKLNVEAAEVKRKHAVIMSQQKAGSRPTSAMPNEDQPTRLNSADQISRNSSGDTKGSKQDKTSRTPSTAKKGKDAKPPATRVRGRGKDKEKDAEPGVDPGVVKAMQDELDAVKASEQSARNRIRERDQQIQDLKHEKLQLQDEYNASQEKHLLMLAEIEQAREANARFEDVKKLLQLSEEERVKLIERVEALTEENAEWRPIQKRLQGRLEQLLEETHNQAAEIEKLRESEDQLRVEKEKNLAAQVQIQSWQDIAAELQEKCERWEGVKDSLDVTVKQSQAEIKKLKIDAKDLERVKEKYKEMLVDLNIELPEEEIGAQSLWIVLLSEQRVYNRKLAGGDEQEDADDMMDDLEDMDNEVDPNTTLRTMSLMKGQLPEVGVAAEDLNAQGLEELADIPPYGAD